MQKKIFIIKDDKGLREMPVLISASAVALTFGLKDFRLPFYKYIRIYPEEYVAEAILPGLGNLHGKWVLLPRAEIARKALPEAIANGGGIAHEIAVYKTLPVQPDPEGLAALKAGVDVVTLTSPSTVQNFVAIARQNGLNPFNLANNPLFACIGPITEQAAREEGLINLVVAKEYTTDGLIQILNNLEIL